MFNDNFHGYFELQKLNLVLSVSFLVSTSSYCPDHRWRKSKYNPKKKSIFAVPEDIQGDEAAGDDDDNVENFNVRGNTFCEEIAGVSRMVQECKKEMIKRPKTDMDKPSMSMSMSGDSLESQGFSAQFPSITNDLTGGINKSKGVKSKKRGFGSRCSSRNDGRSRDTPSSEDRSGNGESSLHRNSCGSSLSFVIGEDDYEDEDEDDDMGDSEEGSDDDLYRDDEMCDDEPDENYITYGTHSTQTEPGFVKQFSNEGNEKDSRQKDNSHLAEFGANNNAIGDENDQDSKELSQEISKGVQRNPEKRDDIQSVIENVTDLLDQTDLNRTDNASIEDTKGKTKPEGATNVPQSGTSADSSNQEKNDSTDETSKSHSETSSDSKSSTDQEQKQSTQGGV